MVFAICQHESARDLFLFLTFKFVSTFASFDDIPTSFFHKRVLGTHGRLCAEFWRDGGEMQLDPAFVVFSVSCRGWETVGVSI